MYDTRKVVSSGRLSGALKPKYRVITTMLGEDYKPFHGLDVFIDFNTLVSGMSTYTKFLNNLPFMEHIDVDMISTVISTFLHWKNFTRKWEDVRIFGFVNAFEFGLLAESSQMKSYLVPYTSKFAEQRFSQLTYYWNEACKVIETIMKYVPNMYMIKCDRFDSYVIPNVIDDYTKNKRDRLVVSGNPLMTNYQFSPRTKVIYSRFTKDGISQLSDPIMIVQSMTKIKEDIMEEFTKSKVVFNLLNTIVGDFDRGIIGLPQTSITSVAFSLLRCMERHEIPTEPKSIESVLPAIDPKYHDYIIKAYPLIDVDLHSQMIKQSLIEKTRAKMIDLYDLDGLNSITIDGINLLELV